MQCVLSIQLDTKLLTSAVHPMSVWIQQKILLSSGIHLRLAFANPHDVLGVDQLVKATIEKNGNFARSFPPCFTKDLTFITRNIDQALVFTNL